MIIIKLYPNANNFLIDGAHLRYAASSIYEGISTLWKCPHVACQALQYSGIVYKGINLGNGKSFCTPSGRFFPQKLWQSRLRGGIKRREDNVIEQVEAALERISLKDPELMTAAIAAIKEANKAKQESHNREVAALKKEHTDIQTKLDRLVDLLAEGVLPPDDYRNKREGLKNRQHDLASLIHAYDEADNSFGGTMEKLMKVAVGVHKAFKSSNLEDKRELLNFVFSNLQLKGANLCYTYNFPFGAFENMDDCSKWRTGWDMLAAHYMLAPRRC